MTLEKFEELDQHRQELLNQIEKSLPDSDEKKADLLIKLIKNLIIDADTEDKVDALCREGEGIFRGRYGNMTYETLMGNARLVFGNKKKPVIIMKVPERVDEETLKNLDRPQCIWGTPSPTSMPPSDSKIPAKS